MAKDSLGLIELTSIASGFLSCDAMLKAAAVDLVLSRSICSGKYMVMVRGDVSSVQSAVAAGISGSRFSVIDSFVIPNLHEAVFPAIAGNEGRSSRRVRKCSNVDATRSFAASYIVIDSSRSVRLSSSGEIEVRPVKEWPPPR